MKRIYLIFTLLCLVASPVLADEVIKNQGYKSGDSAYLTRLDTPSFNSNASGVTATKVAYFADKVGIGALNPLSKLHVVDATANVARIENTAGLSVVMEFKNTGSTFPHPSCKAYGQTLVLSDHTGDVITLESGNVAIGAVTGVSNFLSGSTSQLFFASSVSPTGAVTNGAVLYAYQDILWAADAAGNNTQVSSHDPETGEPYHNSFNVFTGKGEKIYFHSGRIEHYTVDKINPEEFAKNKWIKKWREENPIKTEVAEAEAFETIMEDIEVECPETGKVEYKIEGVKSVAYWINGKKTIQRGKNKLKTGIHHDTKTGKFYLHETPLMESALQAASIDFNFNWNTMPQFVKTAWSK